MAKQHLSTEYKQPLKSTFDTIDCTIEVTLNGSSVPNLEVIGQAFDAAREKFSEEIKRLLNPPKPEPVSPAIEVPVSPTMIK